MSKPARDYEKMRPVIMRAISLGSTPERICAKHMLHWPTLMRHLRKWINEDRPARRTLQEVDASTAFRDLPALPTKAAPMVAKEQNPDRNEQIRQLRRDGLAPAAICRRLRLSRGVVIGVLNRAGMTLSDQERAKAVSRGGNAGARAAKRNRQKDADAYQFGLGCTKNATRLPNKGEATGPLNIGKYYEPIPPHAVPIEDLTGCRWPFGDTRGEGIAYCNKPRCQVRVHGALQPVTTAYCDSHWERRRSSKNTRIIADNMQRLNGSATY